MNSYELIRQNESFIGKDGKPKSTIGFYLLDSYGEKIKITNVYNRDFYRLLERSRLVELKNEKE